MNSVGWDLFSQQSKNVSELGFSLRKRKQSRAGTRRLRFDSDADGAFFD